MKKLILISAIAMSGILFNTADAQIRFHFGLRFAPRPVYVQAPVQAVYNRPAVYNDDYYYLPDVGAYYNVNEQCYYYNDGGSWISAAYLPGAYRDYDWRSARRFEVRAERPYMNDNFYRDHYNGNNLNGRWNNHNDEYGYASNYRDERRNDDHRYEGDDRRFENHDRRNDDHGDWRNHEQYNRDYRHGR